MPNVLEDREKAMDNPQYEDVFLKDRISLALSDLCLTSDRKKDYLIQDSMTLMMRIFAR
jgi:hypothetical protein